VYNSHVTPQRDESELIAAVLGGERAAFGELVGRYQQVAFRAAYLITRDAGLAEEAAQDAFVRAHTSLPSFRRDEPFRPWLLRIVTNLALNQVRGRSRRLRLLQRAGLAAGEQRQAPVDDTFLAGDRQRQLWAAIRELREEDRMVLYLRYFLELPEREIAAVLDVAPGTVKSRLNRAGARLRAVIEDRYPALRPVAQGGSGG